MTQYIANFSQTVASYLPQNEHADAAKRLDNSIKTLQTTLSDQTGEAFKKEMEVIIGTVQKEKKTCIETIERLNGSFFEDPNSELKKASDHLIQTAHAALNIWIKVDTDPKTIFEQLNAQNPDLQVIQDAKQALQTYTNLISNRNRCIARLDEIMSLDFNPTLLESLVQQKNTLEQRQIELTGRYHKDPNSLLAQAWDAYKKAEALKDKETDFLCGQFFSLEEERKSNDAKLINLEKQLSVKPSSKFSYENLTAEDIEKRIATLQNTKKEQEGKAGVNWKKTAIITSPVVVATLGALYYFKK